jgi:hypothetical protein
VSPSLMAAMRAIQRDTQRDRAYAFFYYKREMKMGARRAHYYCDKTAYYSPLELVQRGYGQCYLPRI